MSTAPTINPALAVTPPPPRIDFPTWMPPMLVKELRQGLRTRGFVGSLLVFQCVMAITFMWALAADGRAGVSTAEGFFWGLLGIVLLGVTPLRALAGLHAEIDTKTIDLLLLTRLSAWRIVLGKWVSLMMQALLLVATMLPYAVVRYFFGSVNLVRDLGIIGAMTIGCGVFTAAALWFSGLPKITRILMLGGSFFLIPNLLGFLFRGRMSGSLFSGPGMDAWQGWVMLLVGAAIGTFFCLVHAVRWIAPPAENHASAARLVALGLLLPGVLFQVLGATPAANMQFAIAAVGISLAAALEFMTPSLPMATHLRGLRGGAAGRAWVRWLGLPGWPSAALYLAMSFGLLGCVAWWQGASSGGMSVPRLIWLLVLGWGALTTPAVILAFIPSIAKSTGAIYFVIQAAFGILAALGGNRTFGGASNPLALVLEAVATFLPISSFWITAAKANDSTSWDVSTVLVQAVFILGIVVLVWWRGHNYWQAVRIMAHEAEEAAANK